MKYFEKIAISAKVISKALIKREDKIIAGASHLTGKTRKSAKNISRMAGKASDKAEVVAKKTGNSWTQMKAEKRSLDMDKAKTISNLFSKS